MIYRQMPICLNQDGQDLQDGVGCLSCKSFHPEYPDSDGVDEAYGAIAVDFGVIGNQKRS